jgi:hypothetical protein
MHSGRIYGPSPKRLPAGFSDSVKAGTRWRYYAREGVLIRERRPAWLTPVPPRPEKGLGTLPPSRLTSLPSATAFPEQRDEPASV